MFPQGAELLDPPFQNVGWVQRAVAYSILLQELLAPQKRRLARSGEVVAESIEFLRRLAQEMPQRACNTVAEIQ